MKLTKIENLLIPGAILVALFVCMLLMCAYFLVTGLLNGLLIDSMGVGAFLLWVLFSKQSVSSDQEGWRKILNEKFS
jgi:hypothetical protein